ncbi:uncharacterized protein K452DRAFT_273139 [Aplosporella prunicola CBS 121167]|uniref:PQ loop repeat protein n=1 Tax=Aplosporella prunicola CBS 121167 TaxID=1176127 RepID=A0A6A6B969_9PEZI|nr:uncharacterized protein K452DRAFT_273139 [Aplosporella prunicola CBS 121167]KAF2140536.1 hypothetical protein K452DRAFT_273139 [Aplosporella prunicola CBS 121167]
MDVPVAANVLGTIGAICWSIQLIPQIIINYRRHHAIGLQPGMMILWACAGVPLGVYNIVQDFNIALQVQPQILTFLSLVTWMQCYYYQRGRIVLQSLVVVLPLAIFMAGIEVTLIFSLRIAYRRHIDWPLTLMGVLAAVFLAAGVLTHYVDIYVHRTVRGISFLFVGIDAAGDLFSLISVFFQPKLDVLGMVTYGVELALWLGVFGCGGYFNLLPWLKRKGYLRAARKDEDVRTSATASENERAGGGANVDDVMIQDLPSSTSVFRTPSSDVELRRARSAGANREQPI